MYKAYEDKLSEPENWLSRSELKKFLKMDKSTPKFNAYIQELEGLENSYEFMQGLIETNITYHKIRVYNYINQKELDKKREKRLKKGA